MNEIMIKLQMYLMNKQKATVNCNNCQSDVLPRKEVSVLNLLLFVIIGAVIYFITRNKLAILTPVILGILNSFVAKARCPKCKSTDY